MNKVKTLKLTEERVREIAREETEKYLHEQAIKDIQFWEEIDILTKKLKKVKS